MSYRHLVMFRLYDDAGEADVSAALARVDALSSGEGLLAWRLVWSDDTRKGRILLEDALFASREAFRAWRERPEHAAATEAMAKVADWWIADHEQS